VIVNQWTQAAHRGDAIGDHSRAFRDLARALGHESEIYALTIDPDLVDEIRPWSDPAAKSGDVTIFHFVMPSVMTAAFTTLPGARVLQYHNITPAYFFAPFSPEIARLTILARRELGTLADRTDLALGDSSYNREELDRLGFPHTGVLPILVDTDRLTQATPVEAIRRTLDDDLVNILFVGRLAPNKKIEDHIRLAELFKRYVDTEYRFIFVGKDDAVPAYGAAIRAMVRELRMPPERFLFTGPVPTAELATYYRQAHAYLSLSEHEGFCVPLVEAMAMQVPILAYGCCAVPETLGGAGLCFAPKDLEQAAELLCDVIYDQPLRTALLAGQTQRLADFSYDQFVPQAQALLEAVA
jgi:glycosyltransferase involved in cell wall biosynthesis